MMKILQNDKKIPPVQSTLASKLASANTRKGLYTKYRKIQNRLHTIQTNHPVYVVKL
jgi:hypothetical protein